MQADLSASLWLKSSRQVTFNKAGIGSSGILSECENRKDAGYSIKFYGYWAPYFFTVSIMARTHSGLPSLMVLLATISPPPLPQYAMRSFT